MVLFPNRSTTAVVALIAQLAMLTHPLVRPSVAQVDRDDAKSSVVGSGGCWRRTGELGSLLQDPADRQAPSADLLLGAHAAPARALGTRGGFVLAKERVLWGGGNLGFRSLLGQAPYRRVGGVGQEKDEGEEADTVATSTAPEDRLARASIPAAGAASAKRSQRRSSLWAWSGSAVLVGLFIAGFATDIAHEKGSPEGPEALPYFPNTP